MAYKLELTKQEHSDLLWFIDKGYFPEEVWSGMILDYEMGDILMFSIPEHVAWQLLEFRDEYPDDYLTCMTGTLLDKILKLEEAII